MTRAQRSTALLALAVSAFAAVSAPALADAPGARKAPVLAESKQDQRMTLAPQKPNGSGIVVRYRVEATPQTGKAVPVALSLERVTGSDATVRFQSGSGLHVDAGGQYPRALEAGRSSALTVNVVPDRAGLSYLHVFTTQDGITSVASIPVQVGKGDETLPAVGQLKSTPDGDRILTIPVK